MKPSKFFLEFWVLSCLIITTIINIILLALLLTKWRGSEAFAHTIATNQTVVVVVVQVISHALGITMVQSLCALFRIQFRAFTILQKPVSFERVRFLHALSFPKPVLSDNHLLTIVSILFAIASLVPGALWSGAISPSFTTQNVTATFEVPRYPANLSAVFDGGDVQNANGDFSYDPYRYTPLLMTSAQQSTSRNISQPDQTPHGKLDYSGYSYLTRSYGVGSTVGIIKPLRNGTPITYTYQELGIVANVSCIRNTTSDFEIQYNASSYNSNGISGTSGYTKGSFPTGKRVKAVWLFGALLWDLFAMDTDSDSQQNTSHVIMASAGGTIGQDLFHHVQCGVAFDAHNIQVKVDTARKSITTTVLEKTTWPSYGYNVTSQSMQAIRAMTETDNGYSGSRVGRALWVNAVKLRFLNTGNSSTDDIPESIILSSTASFVTSVFENTLVAIGACRLECANSSTSVPATVEIPSIVYGAAKFIYIITGLNAILLLAAAYTVIRKPWTHTVNLDFGDIFDVALNASRGGTHLFNHFADQSTSPSPRYLDVSAAGARSKFTLQDPMGKFPGIVPAGTTTAPDPKAYMQLQNLSPQTPAYQDTSHMPHRASVSMDRLLDPDI